MTAQAFRVLVRAPVVPVSVPPRYRRSSRRERLSARASSQRRLHHLPLDPVHHGAVIVRDPAACQGCHHAQTQRAPCQACHASDKLAAAIPVEVTIRVSARATNRQRTLSFAHARHGALECSTCHGDDVKRTPVKTCESCHADHHTAARDCTACHPTPRRGMDVKSTRGAGHVIPMPQCAPCRRRERFAWPVTRRSGKHFEAGVRHLPPVGWKCTRDARGTIVTGDSARRASSRSRVACPLGACLLGACLLGACQRGACSVRSCWWRPVRRRRCARRACASRGRRGCSPSTCVRWRRIRSSPRR